MKNSLYLIAIITFILSACSQVNEPLKEKIEPFNTPFGEFNFQRPEFPKRSVLITDFGAQSGGTVKNTEAINKAINDLSEKGGGKVIVPAGKWLTGSITLLSNINLHLEEGAELLFSQDFNDYLPAVLTNWEGSEVYSYSPFIYAYKQENIAITGKGVLNGQGKPWWEQRRKGSAFYDSNNLLKEMNEKQVPLDERRFGSLERFLPPVFFGPLYCKNILLEDITFRYGAFWTVNPSFCENIIVKGIYILTNGEYGDTPNGDGINPNSCKNVLIEYNTLDTGDDCITIKSGRNKDGRRIGIPCKNILIRHNKGLQGHGGIVIGSEMSGGVENVYAHDCQFNGTDRVIRIKTARGRGGYVKNCWFKDISADKIEREAIRINMMYTGGERLPVPEVDEGTPLIENINYENISCDYSKRNVIQIVGIPEMPVKNISLKNIHLKGNLGIEISDAVNVNIDSIAIANDNGALASVAFADAIKISNVQIIDTPKDKIPFVFLDVINSSVKGVETGKEGTLVKITGNSHNINIDKAILEDRIEKH
ncbi:glycoside hydrolase family 28 protein [uncultured Draconibacterium sp.]|uniref:glycoside hydrolase family 28 protein n=1 Tax=uncultured Draconibacterium sp. TaxID=1573823 RepID=UPI0025CBC70A|nr:glycoside hydrolase family 28 protein [uncultured Draconibacterium sp.]